MTGKRVLILSFANDLHALAIQKLLIQHGASADVVDTSTFPQSLSLVQRSGSLDEVAIGGRPLSSYHAIWWRRVKSPEPSKDIVGREEFRFAARESREALWGAIHASGLPIYNRPEAEQTACYKPFQLKLARACGLNVPDTLITNVPEEVERFRARHEQLVFKAFSGTQLMMTDTRPLTDSDAQDLWRLQYAPAIFQEYLPLGREYRVTIIEGEAFSAEIILSDPKAHFDWRMDQNYQVKKAALPGELTARLVQLTTSLGLNSGSVDLRETPDGKVYFLEINPSGQFLFLDALGGLNTGNSFCKMLLQ